MFHFLRKLHKWVGLASSLFLILLAVTGFLLANKGRIGSLRPPETQVPTAIAPGDIIGIDVAIQAVLALGLPEFKSLQSIDRIDHRPKSNIYKILSKEGYREVQVSGATGEVLSVAPRNDQFIEDIHDLSFFGDFTHGWLLPIIAVSLFLLGISGVVVFFTPIVRRWKFRAKQRQSAGGRAESD